MTLDVENKQTEQNTNENDKAIKTETGKEFKRKSIEYH
jgi:hypothetical protein